VLENKSLMFLINLIRKLPGSTYCCTTIKNWKQSPRDRPKTVTVEQGPKRKKWWDGCGALVSLDFKLRKTKVNRDHRQTESVIKDVEDVCWCRTPKNSVVFFISYYLVQMGIDTAWEYDVAWYALDPDADVDGEEMIVPVPA
jgi:hypothetical protein